MLAPEVIKKHKFRNQLHTIILFASMTAIVALLGFLLAGNIGLIASAVLGVLLMFLAPRISPKLILRMYKVHPINPQNAPNLYHMMSLLTKRADLPSVPKLYYIPSKTMNAFAVGSPKSAHIAITDGILNKLNLRELAGVLAHEVSHVSNNDMRVMSFADIMSRLTSLLANLGKLLLLVSLPLYLMGRMQVPWIAILLLIFAPRMVGLLQLALSRTREFNADLHAALLTNDPLGLAEALEKVEYYSGNWLHQIMRPNRGVVEPSIFRSHPDTKERIERLESMEQPQKPFMNFSDGDAPTLLLEQYAETLSKRPRPGGLWV
ncbi:peptidase M48 [marine bacterium AO1-C]|nr:peptidase M48 [marine bacterium AO1-C]